MRLYRLDYDVTKGLSRTAAWEHFASLEEAIEKARSYGIDIEVRVSEDSFHSIKSCSAEFKAAGFEIYPNYIIEVNSKDGSELNQGLVEFYYSY